MPILNNSMKVLVTADSIESQRRLCLVGRDDCLLLKVSIQEGPPVKSFSSSNPMGKVFRFTA